MGQAGREARVVIRSLNCLMISCLFALQPCHSQESLHWSELPQLPDEHGFGGPIVGVHDEVLIVAGGANFPNGPPWSEGDQPPGSKVWHDKIFALQPDAEGWDHAGNLPRSLAYAPAVSTDDGVNVSDSLRSLGEKPSINQELSYSLSCIRRSSFCPIAQTWLSTCSMV